MGQTSHLFSFMRLIKITIWSFNFFVIAVEHSWVIQTITQMDRISRPEQTHPANIASITISEPFHITSYH